MTSKASPASFLAVACSGFALLTGPAGAVTDVDFERDVRPILEARCVECHGSQVQRAGVGLHSWYHSRQIPDSREPILVPGDAAQSHLYQRITADDPAVRMPAEGPPLPPDEVAVIRAWIEAGAPWPDDGYRPPRHWAYERPELPPLPDAAGGSSGFPVHNEIDLFVNQRLAERGLSPNSPAEPARLIRRLHLDLTGLPPTPEQVDRFLSDPSDQTYERIVDELLASPRFGEKWARSWLDLARYADSHGFQRDGFRDIWAFRDWVIDAINRDLPFDQFTIEQIAGDLLPEPTVDQLVATGFNRNAPLNLEAGTDVAEERFNQVVDRVEVTATAWLGTTMGCAQCHNHKDDPISMTEYYRFFAFFNNTPVEAVTIDQRAGLDYAGGELDLTLPLSDQQQHALDQVEHQRTEHASRLHATLQRLRDDLKQDHEAWQALPDNQRRQLADLPQPADERLPTVAQRMLDNVFPDEQALKDHLQALREADQAVADAGPSTTMIMVELAEPRTTRVKRRGDFMSPAEPVEPGVPAALHPWPEGEPLNRLGLARWIASPENPLIGRVTVNRWWAELFGRGLVTTPEEFGSQGDPPSHPELLDWLAATFTSGDHAWSRKTMIRHMVMSAAYRRSAWHDADKAAVDPDNELLWRAPGHRLDAETLRDNALAISGLLSDKMGGPPVLPPQPDRVWRVTGRVDNTYRTSTGDDRFRRGVYTIWRRHAHYPSFANFDAPNRGACTVQRAASNTPLQALTLLNDQAYVEMTRAFALSIADHSAAGHDGRIHHAFRRAVSREPQAGEIEALLELFQSERAHALAHPRAAEDLWRGHDFPDADARAEAFGWYAVATALLNLSETITRG